MLLAFDTSSAAVTVALASPDGEILASSTTVDALRHGELLAPAIADAFATAGVTPRDLTRIAVGVDRKSTRQNSSHLSESRMPSSA